MAISVVQRKAGQDSSGAGPSAVVAFTSNNTAGNAIIVILTGQDSTLALWTSDYPLVSDSQGNTYTQIYNSFNLANTTGTRAYVSFNIKAGANTVTQLDSSDPCVLMVYEVSGLASSSVLDQSATAVITTSTSFVSGNTPTTTIADELIIGIGATTNTTAQSWTLGAGYSNILQQTGAAMSAATQERIVAATGAYSSTLTAASAGSGTATILTFKGAASATASNDPAMYLKKPTYAPNNIKPIVTDY